jgi:hypothetical protein
MLAKTLEYIVTNTAHRSPTEMVQRFQKLRDCDALPTSRGKHAEHLTQKQIAAGILSIVPIKIGYTMFATSLLKLIPFNGKAHSFFHASNLEEAIGKIIEDDDAYHAFLELRATTTQTIGVHSAPEASITYLNCEGKEQTVYFVYETYLSYVSEKNEKIYNPRSMLRQVAEETVYYKGIFEKVRRELRRDKEREAYNQQLERIVARFQSSDSDVIRVL